MTVVFIAVAEYVYSKIQFTGHLPMLPISAVHCHSRLEPFLPFITVAANMTSLVATFAIVSTIDLQRYL